MMELLEIIIAILVSIYSAVKLKMFYCIIVFIIFTSLLVLYECEFNNCVRKRKIALIVIVYFFYFTLSFFADNHTNAKLENQLYKTASYEGIVVSTVYTEKSVKLILRLNEYKENVITYISHDIITDKIYSGNKIRVKGIISVPNESKNYGQFNEKRYLKNQKIYYKLQSTQFEMISNKKNIFGVIEQIRYYISNIYDNNLNSNSTKIIKAMLLGETEYLDSEVKNLYTNGGVIHILAISGMHVSIIGEIIDKLLRKLRVKRKIANIVSCFIIIFYMVFTGMAVSTVRATIMLAIGYIANAFDKQYKSINALIVSAIIILTYNPLNLFNIGFLLSFSAILIIKYPIRFEKILNFVSSKVSTDLSIFIMMAPIVSYNFYSFQGLSILSNMLIVPFTKTLIVLSIIIPFVSVINTKYTIVFAKIIDVIIIYFEKILRFISSLPISTIVTGRISIISIIIFYSVCILLIYLTSSTMNLKSNMLKHRIAKILIIVLVPIYILSTINFPSATINFLDVGHGDATVIITKKNNAVLIDGGGEKNNSSKDTGNFVVYPYLKYKRINKVEKVIVSHPDNDHIKGILELTDLIKINEVILPIGNVEEKSKYKELIEKCKQKSIKVKQVFEGYTFTIDDFNFECIYPPENIDDYNFEVNNYSQVYLVKYLDKKILLTGDIEKEGEEILIKNKKLENMKIDILKIAHHGSKTSSSKELINQISPKYAILSGNLDNIKKFKQYNKWIYDMNKTIIKYTYYEGTITLNMEE